MVDDTRTGKENEKFFDWGTDVAVNVRMLVDVPLSEERVENDASGRVVYQGWAVIGSAEAEAVWLISKLVYDANGFFTDRVWANGEGSFDKTWNNRATYNYSY